MPHHATKTARCRYFDDKGRPLRPFCTMGDNCRFVHPHEVKWATAATAWSKRSNSADRSHPYDAKGRSVRRSPPARYRSASACQGPHTRPLVPQRDLYKLRNDDLEDACTSSWQRKPYYYGNNNERIRSGSFSIRSSREASLVPTKPKENTAHWMSDPQLNDVEGNRDVRTRLPRESMDSLNDSLNSSFTSSASNLPSGSMTLQRESENTSMDPSNPEGTAPHVEEQKWVDKMITLFRRLARLSNCTIQDTVAQCEAERKCQEYNGLSTDIAKLTPTAADIVTRACANITTKQTDAKKRLDDDFEALGHLWEDILDLFVAGVTKAIGSQLETALVTLNSAGREVINSVTAASPTVLKRKLNSGSYLTKDPIDEFIARPQRTESNYVNSGFGEDEFREGKRRRVASSSSQRGFADDDSKGLAVSREADIFLQELKERLEMQALSLDLLTQENSQLKSTLHGRSLSCVPPTFRSEPDRRVPNRGQLVSDSPTLSSTYDTRLRPPDTRPLRQSRYPRIRR